MRLRRVGQRRLLWIEGQRPSEMLWMEGQRPSETLYREGIVNHNITLTERCRGMCAETGLLPRESGTRLFVISLAVDESLILVLVELCTVGEGTNTTSCLL